MRVAAVLSRVPAREELSPQLLDVEQLLDIASEVDLTVLVDHDGTGCDRLRDADVDVSVSEKRRTYVPGGRRAFADMSQISWLAGQHETQPLDLLIQSSSRAISPSVHVPDLATVPRLVTLSDGPLVESARLSVREELSAVDLRYLWNAASWAAVADGVLSDIGADVYGLDAAHLPQRYRVAALPETDRKQPSSVELVTLIARSATPEQLAGALQALPFELPPAATFVLIHHPDLARSSEDQEEILRRVPSRLDGRTLMVAAGPDGAAHEFLAASDWLVCLERADLAVPAVRELARTVPTTVLRRGSIEEPVPAWHEAKPRLRGVDVDAIVSTTEFCQGPQSLLRSLSDRVEVLVLHTPRALQEAQTLRRAPGLARADAAVLCPHAQPFGDPDVAHPSLDALAVHRRLWSSLVRSWQANPDLTECILDALSLSNMDKLRLLYVPGRLPRTRPLEISPHRHGWLGTSGVLPPLPLNVYVPDEGFGAASRSRSATQERPPEFRSWIKQQRWSTRAKLALPWRSGPLQELLRSDDLPSTAREFVKQNTWTERLPLLLPWRYGLLPRAMKGRW